jgi:hypothetical protein
MTELTDYRVETDREIYSMKGENELQEWQRLYVVGFRGRDALRRSDFYENLRRWGR